MKGHYLRSNKGARIPSCLITFATASQAVVQPNSKSTVTYKHRYTHARFSRWEDDKWTREDTFETTTGPTFWNWFARKLDDKRTVWVVGHNLAHHLTVLGFWRLVDAGCLKLISVVDADPPTIIKVADGGGRYVLLDIRNWYRESMDDIDDTFVNGEEQETMRDAVDSVPMALTQVHSLALMRAMRSLCLFVRHNDLGNMKYTVSGQAMAAYRHRFGVTVPRPEDHVSSEAELVAAREKRLYPLLHNNQAVTALERRAGFGVQAACYYVGKVVADPLTETSLDEFTSRGDDHWPTGPLYHFDVNSLLPYVMSSYEYPTKLVGWNQGGTVMHLMNTVASYVVVADVEVCCWDQTYPLKYQGKTVYGRGRFWTTLCGEELRHALLCGHVVNVGFYACYGVDHLFTDFVSYFYREKTAARNDGDTITANLAKLLMNSLYGKWQQRSHHWEVDSKVKQRRRWGRWLAVNTKDKTSTEYRGLGSLVQRSLVRGETSTSFPAIGAMIAANGRWWMNVLRLAAGVREVYYQGGDSLIVTEVAKKRLEKAGVIDPERLGMLRRIGRYEKAEFRNVRQYTLGDRVVSAGLPPDAREVGKHTYKYSLHPRLPSVLDEGPSSVPRSTEVIGYWGKPYDGGIITPGGWVEPYVYIMRENDERMLEAIRLANEEAAEYRKSQLETTDIDTTSRR